MHSKIFAVGLLASLALAKPIERRALTTEYEIVTVWTTITAGQEPAPTAAPERNEAPTVPAAPAAEAPPAEEPAPGNFVEEGAPAQPEPQPELQPAPEPAPAQSEPEPEAPAPAPAPAPEAPANDNSSPAPPADGSYISNILYHHNVHRANHSADPLTWNDALAATARKIAERCDFQHIGTVDRDVFPDGYGQNLGAGTDSDESRFPSQVSEGMYNGEAPLYESDYGRANPSGGGAGHFTQIVWKNTKEIGCATVKCNSLGSVNWSGPSYNSVCNFIPAGNFGGQYAENVGRPLGHATVH